MEPRDAAAQQEARRQGLVGLTRASAIFSPLATPVGLLAVTAKAYCEARFAVATFYLFVKQTFTGCGYQGPWVSWQGGPQEALRRQFPRVDILPTV